MFPECLSEGGGVCTEVQRSHPAEGMKKGQPPVENRADGQGQSQQEVRELESLLHSQETVPTAGMDTPRCGHPTSSPGARQGRGPHTLAIGSQRPEPCFDQGVSADFWELSLRN